MPSSRVPSISNVVPQDWNSVLRFSRDVQKYLGRLSSSEQTVYVSDLYITGTTASRLLSTNASKKLVSTDLSSWVTGTANQVSVANDGDGTITLSTPQDIATDSSVEFGALLVDQNSDAIGLEVDSEATTLTNFGLSITTGQGAIAAAITYGTANEGQFLAGLPNNSSYVGNFSFYRNLTAASTDNAIVYIHQDHADDDQACLELQQDGSGDALIVNGDISCTSSMSITGGVTIDTNIVIPDDGYIGSSSNTDAIQIEADGDIVLTQTLYVTGDVHTSGNILFDVDNGGIGYYDNSPLLVFNDASNQVELTGDLTISGLATATRLIACDANKKLVSTDLASWTTGTANQITVTDDSDGTITLSTPQDIATSSSPTFAGLIIQEADAGAISPKGSYSLATIGKNSSASTYPSWNMYTDADDYPLFSFLPYAHNNFQMCFNWYWNGTASEVCNQGGVYRIFSRPKPASSEDFFSIEWYDASSDDPGDTFATASWNQAFTVDVLNSQIAFNKSQTTFPCVFYGDTDTDLLYIDTDNNKVGIGKTPTAKLDVDGSMAGNTLALSSISGVTLDAGPWSDRPSPIIEHSHIYSALFVGLTSDTGGAYAGTTPAQTMISADLTKGYLTYNYYWTGSTNAQFDTGRTSWRCTLHGNSDYYSISHAPAGSTTLTDFLYLKGSNGYAGFGTSTPSARVHVYDTGVGGTELRVQCGDAHQASIKYVTPSGASYISGVGVAGEILLDSVAGDFLITNRTGGAIRISADTSYYAAVGINLLENGNCGFGILAPSEDVHAADTVRADTAFNLNGTDGWSGTFTNGDGDTVTVSGGIITGVA